MTAWDDGNGLETGFQGWGPSCRNPRPRPLPLYREREDVFVFLAPVY